MRWLDRLKQYVEKKPIIVLKFYDYEWECLLNSSKGANEFTIARSHGTLNDAKPSTPCLILGKIHRRKDLILGKIDGREDIYFGLIGSKGAVSTLESRIKIRRGMRIQPKTKSKLLRLIHKAHHLKNLRNRLSTDESVVVLTPKLSSYLIERLASIKKNHGPLRTVVESLSVPTHFNSNEALQEDAVQIALKAFGLGSGDYASSLELVKGQKTAVGRIPILEDSVIERDARHVPGFELVGSDLTGRAVFKKGDERLEIFTANRRPLEQVFGVDLIYLNASRQNIVMLQYKMLEEKYWSDEESDWIYRPDKSLEKEIHRMQLFATDHKLSPHEYRLNPAVFYLKFVKRDGSVNSGGIIVPIDHFERLRDDPACLGPKGGLRISYNALSGRYLRQSPFLDLIRSGYIGAHAETTSHLRTLVEAVLDNGRSLVAAIQRRAKNEKER